MRRWSMSLLAVVSLGAVVLAIPSAGAHTPNQCERVRSVVSDQLLVLDAAQEAGGLTSAQTAQIQRERAILAAALRHCPVVPSPSSSSVAPSPSSSSGSPSATPSGSASIPPATVWPHPGNTGVPAGWVPAETRTSNLVITTVGQVVQDIRLINASIEVRAANVTIRRVEIQGGNIVNDPGNVCRNGLVVEDVSIVRAPGQVTRDTDLPALGPGGYTARRVKIDGVPEGFRVSGKSVGCTAVTIENSFARVRYPDVCSDWHGDGIQGYDGPALIARNVALELIESGSCSGTAPFFYPHNQGNTRADIDRMVVKGGGFAFRHTMPGSAVGLKVVDGSWFFGPLEVNCGQPSPFEAKVATVDASYQPTDVRNLTC